MPYRVPNLVNMGFQGLNLNCGRYCLEALMNWRHHTPFGQTPLGAPRTEHTAAVREHINGWFRIGFNPGQHAADYGLVAFDLPPTLAEWENLLQNHGPLIVSGHIGAVRIIPIQAAGHYILVVGVTATDIEYLDPLRPQHALGFEPTSMQLDGFLQLANPRGLLAN